MHNQHSSIRFGFTVLLTILVTAESRGVPSRTEAQMYLSKCGYVPASTASSRTDALWDEKSWIEVLQRFQNDNGLSVTGKLDKETLEIMFLPRCVVRGEQNSNVSRRSKRYTLVGSRWAIKNFTYKILNYPSKTKMSKAEVDDQIAKSFALWSQYTDLTFTRKETGEADLQIKFDSLEHGDDDPFDGPSGTLAHGYFPHAGTEIHVDDDEKWASSPQAEAIHLQSVAGHEIGHALGLDHSKYYNALMYRAYKPDVSEVQLHSDDIYGIQALYGKKTIETNIK